jgi:hypothetical protein
MLDFSDVFLEKTGRAARNGSHLVRQVWLVGKSDFDGEFRPIDSLRSGDGDSRCAHPPCARELLRTQANRALEAALELAHADPDGRRDFADSRHSSASRDRSRRERDPLVNFPGESLEGAKCAGVSINCLAEARTWNQFRPKALC